MGKWYASVTYGLEKPAADILGTLGAKNIRVINSAVVFSHDEEVVCKCVNNLFLILDNFKTDSITQIAGRLCSREYKWPKLQGKTFRVIYMDKGKLRSVPESVMTRLERLIINQSGLKPRREKPDIEIWINKLNDNQVFFMVRMKKHASFDKTLKKGELRPDIVEIMISLASQGEHKVLIDPFGGSGAIANALACIYQNADIYTGDIEADCVQYMKNRLDGFRNVTVKQWDALNLPFGDGSADAVITDPPWGEYKETTEGFAGLFINEMHRLLKPGAKLVFLSSDTDNIEKALTSFRYETFQTSIGGKKASLYSCVKRN